jgi:hypothetical protein
MKTVIQDLPLLLHARGKSQIMRTVIEEVAVTQNVDSLRSNGVLSATVWDQFVAHLPENMASQVSDHSDAHSAVFFVLPLADDGTLVAETTVDFDCVYIVRVALGHKVNTLPS